MLKKEVLKKKEKKVEPLNAEDFLLWQKEYAQLLEPVDRQEALKDLLGFFPNQQKALDVYLMLWEQRYFYVKGSTFLADRYMGFLLDLLAALQGRRFSASQVRKATKRIDSFFAKELEQINTIQEELAEEIFQLELYNMIYRYIEVCSTDRMFCSKLFGFGSLKPEKVEEKLKEKLFPIVEEVLGREDNKQYKLFKEAIIEAYNDQIGG